MSGDPRPLRWQDWFTAHGVDPLQPDNPDFQYLSGRWWYRWGRYRWGPTADTDAETVFDTELTNPPRYLKWAFVMGWEDEKGDSEDAKKI